MEQRLQLSTARRPPVAAAEFNQKEGAMSRATGLVLEPQLARLAAAAAPWCPPVPPPAAATPAAQPRMEMVAGIGLVFPAQAQEHRPRLAQQQHAWSEQLASGQLAVVHLVAAPLAAPPPSPEPPPAPSL